jgi:DNA-binding GntR family transcriptional regulator
MTDASLRIEDTTVAEAAYGKLKAAIITGELRPGDPLKERELVMQMGVSRTPIREALQRLAFEGLVVNVPHRGARIRALALEEARELYELRRALEGASAELAAERAGEAEARALFTFADNSTREGGPTRHSLIVNHQFHMGIARLAGNQRLAESIERALDLVSLWRMNAVATGVPYRDTASEHRAVLIAIVTGDGREARRLMEKHLVASWENSTGSASP